jgi:hypothetical protein
MNFVGALVRSVVDQGAFDLEKVKGPTRQQQRKQAVLETGALAIAPRRLG